MPPYEIVVDASKGSLRATLRGFWDLATAQAYVATLAAAAKRVAPAGAPSWWLINLSDSTLQSREVSAVMGKALGGLIPPGAILAVVTGGTLQAMQARRVAADDTHQYFTGMDAAEAWLTAQGRIG